MKTFEYYKFYFLILIYFLFQALCSEVTWVVSDYNGGPGELSVRAGQQVEVLDQNNADQVLVRLCPNTLSEVTRPDLQEGYVPLSCLKAPPSKTFQLSKSSVDADQGRRETLV